MEFFSALLGLIGLIAGFASNANQSANQEKALEQQEEGQNKSIELQKENLEFQKKVADRNFGLLENAYNQQQIENQITREREDTAYQRQVADLRNAGLSPLMVSGGSPATPLSVGSAPQYDATGISSATVGLGSAINELFKTKREKQEIKAALKANIISALGNGPINTMNQYLGAKEQNLRLGILQSEFDYYSEHGYKPTSLKELFSDFLKGISGGKVSNPNLVYNLGDDFAKGVSNFINDQPSQVPGFLSGNESDKSTVYNYAQDKNIPSLGLKDCKLTPAEVAHMSRIWTFTIRDKTWKKVAPVLSEYYDKMPNIQKIYSKELFLKMFQKRDSYLSNKLWGKNY